MGTTSLLFRSERPGEGSRPLSFDTAAQAETACRHMHSKAMRHVADGLEAIFRYRALAPDGTTAFALPGDEAWPHGHVDDESEDDHEPPTSMPEDEIDFLLRDDRDEDPTTAAIESTTPQGPRVRIRDGAVVGRHD